MNRPITHLKTIVRKDDYNARPFAEDRSWAPRRPSSHARSRDLGGKDIAHTAPHDPELAELHAFMGGFPDSVDASLNTTVKPDVSAEPDGSVPEVSTLLTSSRPLRRRLYTHTVSNFSRNTLSVREVTDEEPRLPPAPRWMLAIAVAAIAALICVILSGFLPI